MTNPDAPALKPWTIGGERSCEKDKFGYMDCANMKETCLSAMDGERYECSVCGLRYFLDYDEMR